MAWIEATEQNLEVSLGIELRDLERRDEAGQRQLLHERLVEERGRAQTLAPGLTPRPLTDFRNVVAHPIQAGCTLFR